MKLTRRGTHSTHLSYSMRARGERPAAVPRSPGGLAPTARGRRPLAGPRLSGNPLAPPSDQGDGGGADRWGRRRGGGKQILALCDGLSSSPKSREAAAWETPRGTNRQGVTRQVGEVKRSITHITHTHTHTNTHTQPCEDLSNYRSDRNRVRKLKIKLHFLTVGGRPVRLL